MAVKGIRFSEIKAKTRTNPEIEKTYVEETQEEENHDSNMINTPS